MIRISLAYIYNLAKSVEPAENIKPGQKISEKWFDLLICKTAVEELVNGSVFAREIRTSRQAANGFITLLKRFTEDLAMDKEL
jgi:hypothetical protein